MPFLRHVEISLVVVVVVVLFLREHRCRGIYFLWGVQDVAWVLRRRGWSEEGVCGGGVGLGAGSLVVVLVSLTVIMTRLLHPCAPSPARSRSPSDFPTFPFQFRIRKHRRCSRPLLLPGSLLLLVLVVLVLVPVPVHPLLLLLLLPPPSSPKYPHSLLLLLAPPLHFFPVLVPGPLSDSVVPQKTHNHNHQKATAEDIPSA